LCSRGVPEGEGLEKLSSSTIPHCSEKQTVLGIYATPPRWRKYVAGALL
jgi:hypothetical protein